MKKKKKQSLEEKLKAYSVAAAGTLLLAPSANAAVQYSGPQNIGVSPGSPITIDLNNDGFNDFEFGGIQRFWAIGGDFYWNSSNFIALSTGGKSLIDYNFDPANLPINYPIQQNLLSTLTFRWDTGTRDQLAWYYRWAISPTESSTNTRGNFIGSRGYIGVSFDSTVCTHYGWIQYDGTLSPPFGTIVDWAYEDNCGTAILAGATAGGSPSVSAPTLNQWGMFALIALLAGAGTLMLRKKEESS